MALQLAALSLHLSRCHQRRCTNQNRVHQRRLLAVRDQACEQAGCRHPKQSGSIFQFSGVSRWQWRAGEAYWCICPTDAIALMWSRPPKHLSTSPSTQPHFHSARSFLQAAMFGIRLIHLELYASALRNFVYLRR